LSSLWTVSVCDDAKGRIGTKGESGEDVFLHILANARQVNLGSDANVGEYFWITDARKL
jgi:hypothetical protein